MNRATRKRVERNLAAARKEFDRLGGNDLTTVSRRLELGQYVETLELLDQGPAALAEAVLRATERVVELEASAFLKPADRDRVDCRAGCAWCCHQPLQVSPLDAVAMTHHLLPTLDRDRLQAYTQDLSARLPFQREKLKTCFAPCPFLDTETSLCTAYESRPVVCRAFHSTSVEHCRAIHDEQRPVRTVPMFELLMGFVGLPLEGAHRALGELGVDLRPVVLGVAVALLAEDFEGLTRAWLAGERVFEPAVVS